MLIYHYSPDNGEYTGNSPARSDPQVQNGYLVPRFATALQPPEAGPDQVAVFSGGAWTLMDDFRGNVYWRVIENEVEAFSVDVIGAPVPEDALTSDPGARPDDRATWSGVAWEPGPVTPDMIRAEASLRIEALGPEYTASERQTWAKQMSEAADFVQNGPSALTPLIDGIAAGRGVSRADMAAHVLMKVDQFSAASGVILGKQAALLAMDPIPQDYATNETYWE